MSTVDVSHLFPDVPPLAALTGVYPGISVDELRKLRKAATDAPYIGLIEILGTDTIRYRVNRPPSRQSRTEDVLFGISKLTGTSRIEGIDLWRPSNSADSAEGMWLKTATLLRERKPNELQCFKISRISGITRFALARLDSIRYGVALIEESHQPSAGGSVTIPAVVDTFVTSQLDIYAPNRFSRESIPCP